MIFLSDWCENTSAAARDLAASALASGESANAIMRLLRQVYLTFQADQVFFFELPPFQAYQTWPVSPSATDTTKPPATLQELAASIDWDNPGPTAVHPSPGESTLMLAPVMHRHRCIACLVLDISSAPHPWRRARQDLLDTTVSILGEVLGRRNIENKLKKACDRFMLIGQLSGVGMWDWDITTDALYWSVTVNRLFGIPAETELSYERFMSSVHPEDKDHVMHAIRLSIEANTAYRCEHRIIRPDGEIRWMLEKGGVIRNNEGEAVRMVGIVKDITDQKIARQQLEDSQQLLRNEEARRLSIERQQREALVREVHHRIKNNLQGIMGLLRQELGSHPELTGAVENAISKVRSIAIVHGLQSQGGHGEIYLCEIVEAIVNALREVLGKSIDLKLETRIDPPLKILPEEAVPVALILNELLTNALKHGGSSEGSSATRIEFTTRNDRGVILIYNKVPTGKKTFDLDSGEGLGTGLELVRSLLPHKGAQLGIRYLDVEESIEARLELTEPVIMLAGQSDRKPDTGGYFCNSTDP